MDIFTRWIMLVYILSSWVFAGALVRQSVGGRRNGK